MLSFSHLVMANWILISDTKDQKTYADVMSMKFHGDVVRVWTYQDYSQPNKGSLSVRMLMEIDCKKKLFHPLYITAFKNSNLAGDSENADLSKKVGWEKISQKDSDATGIEKLACNYQTGTHDWKQINLTEDAQFFSDFNSRIVNGDSVKVTEYQNYMKPFIDGSYSAKSEIEYDCKKESLKVSYHMTFSGKDLRGELISFTLPDELTKPTGILKNSIMNATMQLVCEKQMNGISAKPEWILINSNEGLNNYIDYASIRKTSNKVMMWDMSDYKKPQESGGVKYLSSALRYEYDCQEKTIKLTSYIAYEGNMGVIPVSINHNVDVKTSQVMPNTTGQDKWEIACGSR
jgi:hypothetical protein